MRRFLYGGAAALLLLAVTACGQAKSLTPPALPALLEPGATTAQPAARTGGSSVRIVVVTHGQASDPYWAVVRRGIDDAARQLDVSVSYEAPDSYDLGRMNQLIRAAAATHPDGLVVSLPNPRALAASIRHALAADIPVVSINSGDEAFRALGIAVHIGQPEYQAGLAAGTRLAQAGIRRALCVIHEAGNLALRERCRGVADALRRAGTTVRVLTVNLQDPKGTERTIAAALRAGSYGAMITLGGASIAAPALAAIAADRLHGKIVYATFGIGPEVLRAVRDGRIRFAVDQQPYLQGYLPIALLALYHRYGVLPTRGTLIATGPIFVTKATAASMLTLSARGVR